MSDPQSGDDRLRPRLTRVLAHARRAVIAVCVISGVLNVVLLGGSIYMMLVYDFVLPSSSIPTLVGLAVMVTFIYAIQGSLDFIRGRLLMHFGAALDTDLSPDVHKMVSMLVRTKMDGDPLQPVRDLDQLRGFLSGPGPATLADLPWMFLFIGFLFLLHPYLGWTVLVGGVILNFMTYLTERLTVEKSKQVILVGQRQLKIAEVTRRHSEAIVANDMEERVCASWSDASRAYLAAQEKLTGVASRMGSLTRMLRLLLQSGVLTVGALLVIDHAATGGVIFASSILSARALAPVEGAIANWRGFVSARQSWARLKGMVAQLPEKPSADILAAPCQTLRIQDLSVSPPGSERKTVLKVNFGCEAASAIAVIGPSESGKSSLARALVGIWPASGETIKLDGADLSQWNSAELGLQVGYVPPKRRTDRGHHCPKYRPFRSGSGCGSGGGRRNRGQRTRLDPATAAGLQQRGRVRWARPVRRAASADRIGASLVRQPFPDRTRRTQRKSRCLRRRGPFPGHSFSPIARSHRYYGRTSPFSSVGSGPHPADARRPIDRLWSAKCLPRSSKRFSRTA
jgi:ABC-type protease/lipase transport system fused ATPase/permease subunit